MIVEVKTFNDKNKLKKTGIERIMQQTHSEEKKRIKQEKVLAKQTRLEKKEKNKYEKELAKQARLEEKKQIKERKKLAKQARLEEEKQIKERKKLAKQKKRKTKKNQIVSTTKSSNKKVTSNIDVSANDISKFDELVKKIVQKNMFRPYPSINDIPN